MELFGALNTYHVAFVVLGMGLAGLAVWSRRRLAPRVYAVSLFAALMVVGFGSLADLLGRPKPAQFEWFRNAGEELQVLGSDIRENEAIYLWVRQAAEPPRAYALPWNMEVAKQLFGAQSEAQESGRGVRMRGRLNPEAAEESEPVFYPDPQEALPPKQAPGMAGSPVRHF